LSIKWYDAEGCIESTPIDIIQHLHLLVVVLNIIQRSKRLRGYGDAKTSLDSIGTVHMDTAVGPNFELSGRRTFGASFTLKPSTPLPTASNLNTSSDHADPDGVALNYNAIPGHSAALVNDYTPMETRSSTRRKTNPNLVALKAEDAQHFLKISWPKRARQKSPLFFELHRIV